MRVQLNKLSSAKNWLLFALISSTVVACGDNGRDPILGNPGNTALAPTVTVVSPANNATNVAVTGTLVTAQFSEPVNAQTTSTFTLTCAAPCSAPTGTVAMNGSSNVATYTITSPAVLSEMTRYTATIHSAVSRANGLTLAAPYSWSFTTGIIPDTTLPRVTLTEPVTTIPGPTLNVPVNTTVSAQFSEAMLATTITASNFTLSCSAPCLAPTGEVNYTSASRTAVLTADEALDWETTYTATVSSNVTDLVGNPLSGNQGAVNTASDYVWQFTTGLTPDTTRPRVTITEPLTTSPGPTPSVPVNTAITAIFTEDMLATTVNDSSFTLTCAAPCVSPLGEVTYVAGSRSAVFSPDQNLDEGVTYTATIASTVTDLALNRLAGNQAPATSASDYIWLFTTVAPLLPLDNISVQATDPLDAGELPVCPNAMVNATFAVPSGTRLNPTTVNDMTFLLAEDGDPLATVIAESIQLDVDSGRIISFVPQTQLAENVTYRATLVGGTNGIKDLIVPGNEMLEDYQWTFTTIAPIESCLQAADLKSAAPFGSFGGTAGVTNQGLLTIINGDLGTTGVSTLVTGFVSEPGCEYTITPLNEGHVNGRIFTSPPPPTVACPQDGTAITQAIAMQARLDAEAVFIELSPANLPGGQDPGNDNLGNLTLAPGIYTAQSGAFMIQGGDLTLDGQGNQNAVWVFQMATTLTVGGPGADFPQSVTLINGAQAKNIFWQVGSSATINAAGGGTMKGTIIAQSGVSISTAGNVNIVTLDGRALSLGASVTVVNTVINVPAE